MFPYFLRLVKNGTRNLTFGRFDCATVGGKHDFVPPEHRGPLPAAIDGHKLYIGSCHCGEVTLAFMSEPLDETFDDQMVDCDCSICVRVSRRSRTL
jgi:hypothetical protein